MRNYKFNSMIEIAAKLIKDGNEKDAEEFLVDNGVNITEEVFKDFKSRVG